MTWYILQRLLHTIPVLVGVSVLAFAIMNVVPGYPVRLIAGSDAPEDVVARIRAELGLSCSATIRWCRAACCSWPFCSC
jgi:peptide/nickel transport system permease protein